MKKDVPVKYAHSANLFQFCRKVLDHKFGGIRVIDQDVGQILGFDPADCSHWKKGKKNIRSIQAMKAIADHLGVDEKLVVDVASGDIDESEAFNEYCGYGAFQLDGKVIEAAKKDFYRNNAGNWSKDRETEFRNSFSANEPEIDQAVKAIHAKINFGEAPLYLPEVISSYPDIELTARSSGEENGSGAVTVSKDGDRTTITYTSGTEMKPYMRYQIAKALAEHFLSNLRPQKDKLSSYDEHLIDVQKNLFAAKLLAPAHLIRKEMAQINVAKDIVSQLSEVFWVSKTFMNRRLKDILQGSPTL
mgnify:CR=1 FL=1